MTTLWDHWGRSDDAILGSHWGGRVVTSLGSLMLQCLTSETSVRSYCDLTDGIYKVAITPDRYCSYQIMKEKRIEKN